MSRPVDMTAEALAGYRGEANPHLATSPAWYAHECGRYLADTGRSTPSDVRMGRGASVNVRDMNYRHDAKAGTFERIR